MILEKLVIENFRPFRGKQELVFSTTKRKNITIIHAENGFGKTALLNALLWGFYGHEGLTPDLEKPDRIIHEGLAADCEDPEALVARVTILFDEDGAKFTLTRSLSLSQERADSRKTDLVVDVQREGQTFANIDKPKEQLQAIIPFGISRFLFFNGERIDHLAMDKNAAQITEAIRQVLGLKLLKTTIEDLEHQSVRGRLNRDLADNSDEQTNELIQQEEELERIIRDYREELETCRNEQAATDNEIKGIDAKMEANRLTRELQQTRSRLESERDDLEDSINETRQRLKSTIADRAFVLFAEELVEKGKSIAQNLRREGKIPARVVNSFVEELLDAHRCICGCELIEGTPEYQKVTQLLEIAGDQQFNTSVSALDNAIGAIQSNIVSTRDALTQDTGDLDETRRRLRETNEALQEVHAQLGDSDDEEVHQLEETRHELTLKLQEFHHSEGRLDRQISESQTNLETIRREIETVEQRAGVAERARRRLNALSELTDLLRVILDHEMRDMRTVLNSEIDTHFQKIIDRECWAELSEEFVLRIKKKVGHSQQEIDVAQNSGLRQLTSLVFIGSLVALARKRAEIPTILRGLDGGEFPIVMDAPFSNLGDAYRKGVAKWIPNLAPQVVILVASSHYQGSVEETLEKEKRIGRRYLLQYHGPEKPETAQPNIKIGDKPYTIYCAERDEEFTEISEIS